MKQNKISQAFITLAIFSLIGGLFFGCIASYHYILPDVIKDYFSFNKLRPLHVSLTVAWIFLVAIGGIYHALPKIINRPLYSNKLAIWHYWIFLLTGILILICYFLGIFGGREYWAFPPVLAFPILISWVLFGINFFATVKDFTTQEQKNNPIAKKMVWPVYLWMWATGIIFFFITFSETYLWLLPYFRKNIIGEITVQWKSYGALVGSWNMLVYGLAIYVMEKTSEKKIAYLPASYFLYFLGFINLLLGWSHHIYILPAAKWIRLLGYAISMTELIVLAKVIWDWKGLIKQGKQFSHIHAYRFLLAADFWILVNLILAILISIPSINLFTHGTHITVAHAMGSTIGINSMILLAVIFYFAASMKENEYILEQQKGWIKSGFWISNIALLVFFVMLIISGALKSYYTFQQHSFQQIMRDELHPYFIVFALAGIFLLVGFTFMVFPLLKRNKQEV